MTSSECIGSANPSFAPPTDLLGDLRRNPPTIGAYEVGVDIPYQYKIHVESGVGGLILPDGEETKSLDTIAGIYDHLLEGKYDRKTGLVELGGGVIGDITGFAAATYQRGINFIQIPTTLLAQVDSSVGGKTGVNHALGKNMIGSFYQPQCVIADTEVLGSLPEREVKAGLAEVLKYGLINNAEFFKWLAANSESILALEHEHVSEVVRVCCEAKAAIVAQDEKEAGVRALLNLGHTFGHAIETVTGYGAWLHGETVAMGMVMAADLSRRLGWLSSADAQQIRQALNKIHRKIKVIQIILKNRERSEHGRAERASRVHIQLGQRKHKRVARSAAN